MERWSSPQYVLVEQIEMHRNIILQIFVALATAVVCSSSLISSCKDVSNLPCVEVSACSKSPVSVTINKLSSGTGSSNSYSTLNICYDSDSLVFSVQNFKQSYFPKDMFTACNDAVYLLDVLEVFIAKDTGSDPHCYSEIDSSPYTSIFESGIYNPYLNHTGVSNYLIDCQTSGVKHATSTKGSTWNLSLTIPWNVIDNPVGCPANYVEETKASSSKVYRANFYRVNELTATTKCSSSTCEYMAWSPTDVYPPAFHEPTKFGYLILV